MKRALYEIWAKVLTAFGNVKIFRWPLFFVYDPDDYQVTGKQLEEIQETIQPGDIILRGYRHYLDGRFVPNFPNDVIGEGFSHGAIYIGKNQIIHAVAEGVSKINLLDFCQCDRVAIFRPISGQRTAITKAKKYEKNDTKYDFSFSEGESCVYCFELCSLCYPKLDIKKCTVKKLFGLLKKDVYVAQSFIDSKDLDLVYCWNPKSSIYVH